MSEEISLHGKVFKNYSTSETDYKFVAWGGECKGGCNLESRS